MSLDNFMIELRKDVVDFEKHWREEHEKNPKNYPMEIVDDNEGIWYEQFISFIEMKTDK